MSRHLPATEWRAAQHELEALRKRARMINEPDIEAILGGIHRTLGTQGQPLVAACELEMVAELIPRYPQLQKSLHSVARRIYEYPMPERSPSR